MKILGLKLSIKTRTLYLIVLYTQNNVVVLSTKRAIKHKK